MASSSESHCAHACLQACVKSYWFEYEYFLLQKAMGSWRKVCATSKVIFFGLDLLVRSEYRSSFFFFPLNLEIIFLPQKNTLNRKQSPDSKASVAWHSYLDRQIFCWTDSWCAFVYKCCELSPGTSGPVCNSSDTGFRSLENLIFLLSQNMCGRDSKLAFWGKKKTLDRKNKHKIAI